MAVRILAGAFGLVWFGFVGVGKLNPTPMSSVATPADFVVRATEGKDDSGPRAAFCSYAGSVSPSVWWWWSGGICLEHLFPRTLRQNDLGGGLAKLCLKNSVLMFHLKDLL